MEARRHELPERSQAALDLLTSDVSRFQGLVEDLLEISRFDAGAIRLHLEDLPVVQFVAQRRRRQLGAAHPGRRRRSGSPTTVIRGDRRRLARVIANLIDNAKAYGGGEPEVTISAGDAADEPLAHVRIGVEDHGPGVPVEERALIFERFARGATAGRRSGQRGCRARPGARRRARAHARRPGVGGGPPRRRAGCPLRDRAAHRSRWKPRRRSSCREACRAPRRRSPSCRPAPSSPTPGPGTSPAPSASRSTRSAPDAGESTASSRVFLLTDSDGAGERPLRSVLRSVEPPTAEAVIEELFNGPNADEFESRLRHRAARDPQAALGSARSPARSTSTSHGRSSSCRSPELQLAVAEIVFTANELPGVREVRLTRRRRAACVAGRPRRAADRRRSPSTTSPASSSRPNPPSPPSPPNSSPEKTLLKAS